MCSEIAVITLSSTALIPSAHAVEVALQGHKGRPLHVGQSSNDSGEMNGQKEAVNVVGCRQCWPVETLR